MPDTTPKVSTRPDRAQARASGPCRVLLVDDDRDGAKTLATLLELEGYAVHEVHGGQEALDAARELNPEVVLLDIGMPKLSGYEVARRLRSRYGDQCPVLIAVTGWKQASDRILASLAGFDHHVAKPYAPADILTLLSKVAPAAR